jgi:hypothetical protein
VTELNSRRWWKLPLLRLERSDVLALCGLGALVLGALFPALFLGRAFFEWDIFLLWHTQVRVFADALAQGSWPVWNSGVAFGQPLLADANHQVFYPLTWFHLLLPPAVYHSVFAAFHLWFSAVGVYALGRRLGFSSGAAFSAAAFWSVSGPLVSLVYVWNHFVGACWIPWVLLSADRAVASRRVSPAFLWGAVTGLQLLTGSPDMVLYAQVLVAAHILHLVGWGRASASANRRVLTRIAVAAVFAVTLSAAQWLPSLEAASRSARQHLSYEFQAYWSVHPITMLQAAFPIFPYDLPLLPELREALFGPRRPFLDSIYLGAPVIALAAAAFTSRARRSRLSWLIVAVFGALVAMGRFTPLHDGLVKLVPPFAMLRYPVKALVMTAFGAALLAGAGVDAWRESREATRTKPWILLTAGVILLALANGFGMWAFGPGRESVTSSFLARAAPEALREIAFAHVVATALSVLIVLAALFRRRARARLILPLIVGLALADLVWTHRQVNPTVPRSSLSYRPPTVDLVRAGEHSRIYAYDYFDMQRSRRYLGRDEPFPIVRRASHMSRDEAYLLGLRTYLFPPGGAIWGLEGSYDMDFLSLYPRPLDALVRFLRTQEGTPVHDRLLRLGAVGHVVALHAEGFEALEPLGTVPSPFPEPVHVFGVPDPLPRTYAVGGARVADGAAALSVLAAPSFDPRREILVPEGSPSTASSSFRGVSRIVSYAPDRVLLEAQLTDPGYVVLVDSFDPGWRATVDGERASVTRANVAFRAVSVPRGRHLIEYRYRPWSVSVGLAISVTALLTVLVAGVFRRGRRAPAA